MFYHFYEGKSRKYFEDELVERFGSLVKMPLLKPDKSLLPVSLRSILEVGINLYNLHTNRHGRLESTKGLYAREWAKWEKKLRDTLSANAEYLNSIQVNIIIIIFYYYLHLKIEEWEGGFFLLLFSNFKICLSF